MYTVEEYIEYLKNGIANLSWSNCLECIIIFGSLINIPSLTRNRDIDLCIVLKDRSEEILLQLREYLNEFFIEPDITVYFLDELQGRLPFRDIGNGTFALEYFATGRTIFGRNIFIELLMKASKEEYKKSILDKIFDYILRIRKAHILISSFEEKTKYINKYFVRLLIDVLVYFDYETLVNLQKLKNHEIVSIAEKNRIVIFDENMSDIGVDKEGMFPYSFLYKLYTQLSSDIDSKLQYMI